MPRTRVRVDIPGAPYFVHVGEGTLTRVGDLLPPPALGQTAAVVADETTAELFGAGVVESLKVAGWRPQVLVLPPGEGSKTLRRAAELYRGFARAGLDRASMVFALGGGVVGDVAGFAAATYLRGIGFVPLPTTLLAQVDSSVGGKVGVDLPQGKNLVGAFHQPRAVVVDPGALRSLPERELRAGLAEVVKHAAIADAALFRELERHAPEVLGLDLSRLTRIVAANCRIKAAVVAADPEERGGRRAVLNYGHTLGHALERAASSWGLRHGEAVALGMVAEAKVAARAGLAGPEPAERLTSLLVRLGLPVTAPRRRVSRRRAEAALRADKKVVRGAVLLPVVARLGQVELTQALSLEALAAGLDEILV